MGIGLGRTLLCSVLVLLPGCLDCFDDGELEASYRDGQASAREVDPLMGWTSSSDTQTQVKLTFASLKAAKAYARQHGIDAVVQVAQTRKPNIRAQGYAENFATNRRGAWTH